MSRIEAPARWSEARPLLLPVLRRITEPAHAWYAALADPDNALVSRAVAPMLHALVVVDLPGGRVFVNAGHLRGWGVSADAVHAAALANLTVGASDGLRQQAVYGGLWQVSPGDGHETARLLLPRFLDAFAEHVEGEPIAAIPAGRVLLVGGSGSASQLSTLLDLAERAFRAADGPLSPVLYGPDGDGGFAPWEPPADHPLRRRILAMRKLLEAHEYECQREQLADNPTIRSHVAEVSLVHATDEDSFTLARWDGARGETLLPVVDRIVLVDGDDETEVPWGALTRHAAGCLGSTRLRPERLRARWPLPATLDRIRSDR